MPHASKSAPAGRRDDGKTPGSRLLAIAGRTDKEDDMRTHDALIGEQFGGTAAAYLTSAVHARGEDLQDLAARAGSCAQPSILDLGCGGGHASFAVAPHAASVVAYDLSAEMLAVVAAAAAARGLGNIETRQGSVEQLPFAAARFDIICTRFSAHHWRNPQQALAEATRVLKSGGWLIVIDTAAPADVLADTWLQTIELLRDPSHVRNADPATWRSRIERTGLCVMAEKNWKLELEFAAWTARMRTPAERVVAIRSLWRAAPVEVRDYFSVGDDDSFAIDAILIEARKP